MIRKNYKKLIQDLSRLPLFNIPDRSRGCDNYGECRSFRLRWIYRLEYPGYKAPEDEYEIQFAYKKTFDRWANSVNFVTQLSYVDKYRSDIVKMHLWAEKVCRSKLFDFNSYIYNIEMPWINPIDNNTNAYL